MITNYRFPSFLSSRHHDAAAAPRSRPATNRNVNVAVQRGQKIHQPFHGKALQLVIRREMDVVSFEEHFLRG